MYFPVVLLFYICFPVLTEHILQDLVRYGVGSRRINPSEQTDIIVFCSGGFENFFTPKSEG